MTADQLPLAQPALKKQVEKIGAKKATFNKATMGGESALHGSYTLTQQGVKVKTDQCITVKGDLVYTVTFSHSVALSPKVEKQTVASAHFL